MEEVFYFTITRKKKRIIDKNLRKIFIANLRELNMRYALAIILASILQLHNTVKASQEWKLSSCSPNGGSVSNSFDCSLISDGPISWCYDGQLRPDQFNIYYIQMSYPTVKCGYRHKWNWQGSIQWGRNIGDSNCAPGKVYDPDSFQCVDEESNQCMVGNPISLSSGNKIQTEVDLSIKAYGHQFDLKRFYNASKARISTNSNAKRKTWLFQYEDKLNYVPIYTGPINPDYLHRTYIWEMANGKKVIFNEQSDGSFQSILAGIYSNLVPVYDGTTIVEWIVKDLKSDEEYTFGSDGYLKRLRHADGQVAELTDSSYRLSTDVEINGRLVFQYIRNFDQEVTSVELPDGNSFTYVYDNNRNIIQVINPDGVEKNYYYQDPNYPQLLTSIMDEEGVIAASWNYDAAGLATSSEHADGVEKVTVDYSNFDDLSDPRVTYTNTLGYVTTVRFEIINGKRKPVSIEKPATQGFPSSTVTLGYDQNAFLVSRTDENGNVTSFTRDELGRELSRTEGLGSLEERIITTSWDGEHSKPSIITHSDSQNIYSYDSSGRILSNSVMTNDGSREWRYTYNSLGLIESMDGPRTDVNDVTTYTYLADGELNTITNPLGHVITYDDYHYTGLPQTIIDENGIVSRVSYNWRGLVTEVILEHPSDSPSLNSTTSFEYDDRGLVTQSTNDNGSYIRYEYNNARFITAIENQLGERQEFTYDSAGNVTNTVYLSAIGNTIFSLQKSFNALNQLISLTSGSGVNSNFTYTADGRVNSVIDGRQFSTLYTFDSLNRIATITDGTLGVTEYKYDSYNRILSVEDAQGALTEYTYTGLGEQSGIDSPDTGLATSTYDEAGNLITYVDARGVQSDYTYDSINRLIEVDFPAAPAERISYTYDNSSTNNFGIGRLTGVTDDSGTTSFSYDHHGNIISKSVQIDNVQYETVYEYERSGTLDKIVYPTGRVIEIERDSSYRVSAIKTRDNPSSSLEVLVNNVSYLAFGPMSEATYDNGITLQHYYDLSYRIERIRYLGSSSIYDREYRYDDSNNINEINNLIEPSNSQNFIYDGVSRLLSAVGSYGQTEFSYDLVGNRLSKTNDLTGLISESYSYVPLSNKLSEIDKIQSGANTEINLGYDAAGNITSKTNSSNNTTFSFNYNNQNRLSEFNDGTNSYWYTYNALGQRVKKLLPTGAEHYHFNEEGKLISRTTSTGSPVADYIYDGERLLYTIRYSGLGPSYSIDKYVVVSDHLETPTALVDSSLTVVWSAEQAPFGATLENTDPDNDGNEISFNIRFPGQYRDQESGLYYNYFRDYDPEIGRYIQSDPIGLAGGINTYGYAGGNPVNRIDPEGLNWLNPRNWFMLGRMIGNAQAAALAAQRESDSRARNKMCEQFGALCLPSQPMVDDFPYQNSEDTVVQGPWKNIKSNEDTGEDECENDDERCERNLARDMATCDAIGKRHGKGAFKICEKQAMLRYGNCLSGRDNGIDAPLPPWGSY